MVKVNVHTERVKQVKTYTYGIKYMRTVIAKI